MTSESDVSACLFPEEVAPEPGAEEVAEMSRRLRCARLLAEEWINSTGEGGPGDWEILGAAARDLLQILDGKAP